MDKDYAYYKQLVQERGPIFKYPGDCGCLECQTTYAWIEDDSPGRAEEHQKIMDELNRLEPTQ